MSKRILIFFFVVCTLSACTTYNSAIKRYESLPGPKALASAYDNENRWAVGYSSRSPSVEVAKSVALTYCENGRTKRNVQSPCKVYIAHDTNSNPVPVTEHEYGFEQKTFVSFGDMISHYKAKPNFKVLWVAYDPSGRWAAGFFNDSQTMDGVSDKAYEDCEQSRQKANILAKCSVYAVNDKIYYREPSELVKSPLETPSPSTPPAYKEPSPVPKPDLKKKQEISYGTGFAVRGDGYILTSYHIISGADSIAVSYQSRKHVTAKLIKHSSTNDIALLKINEKTPQYLELEEPGNVNIGERVFTIGFPVMELLGAEPKYSEGTISSLAGFYDEASFMQISVPVQPGNSGGPLLNEKGKVVGIITATAAVSRFLKTTGTLPQNVNWAVKADIARTLFKAPKPSKTSKFERQAIISRARDSVCIIGVIKTE